MDDVKTCLKNSIFKRWIIFCIILHGSHLWHFWAKSFKVSTKTCWGWRLEQKQSETRWKIRSLRKLHVLSNLKYPHTHLNPSILPMLPYHMCTYVFRHIDWHHQNPTTLNITISIELLTYIVTPTWKKIGHSALHHGLHHTWCQHLPTPRR